MKLLWLHYFSFRFTVWRSRQFFINNGNISLPLSQKIQKRRRESPEYAFAIPETTPFNGARWPQRAANQLIAGSLRTDRSRENRREEASLLFLQHNECSLCRTNSKPAASWWEMENLKLDLQRGLWPWRESQSCAMTRKTWSMKIMFLKAIFHLHTDSQENHTQKMYILAILQL